MFITRWRWNAAIATLQLCDGVTWRSVSVGPQTFTIGGAVSGLVGHKGRGYQMRTAVATIGIRGTGWYAEADPEQTVRVLRDIEGLSTEEASAALNVKTQTLKSRLHRGRLFLRADNHLYCIGGKANVARR